MKGKNKCKILKEIRQKIADENDIPYVTRECTYQGDCRGTCPKCEAELRYLEQELEKRRRLGKTVAVAAVAATLSLGLAGCVPGGTGGGSTTEPGSGYPLPGPTQTVEPDSTQTPEPLEGEIVELEGDVAAPTETEEPPELLGNLVYFPETPEELPAESPETEKR
ncbi:MAG: hypothetical protein IJG08_01655 [Oscillospiraceae bacterium]|nr:hypothetical protein [Oscillospiraceae bacterium]